MHHYEILNVYHLPRDSTKNLYTPVNSFRLIFNTYIGTHYDLLPDMSFTESGQAVPETSPACIIQ
jgi:hypothetical protein